MTTLRILFCCALALAGCATTGGEPGEPDYATDAETNFQRGVAAFNNREYLEAEKYFEHVKSKFPFAEASKEAELKLADTHFERERYLESRDAYQSFNKLHPTHPKVDYAAFRAALTHYKEVPEELIILPPSREKDQGDLQQALRQFNEFLRLFPKS